MQEQQKGQPQSHSQNFHCKECGKTLNSPEELRDHEKTHQGRGQQTQGQGGTTHKAGGGGA